QDSVDVLGRTLHQKMQCDFTFSTSDPGIPCRDWLTSQTRNRFNRLGELAIQLLDPLSGAPVLDTLRYDRSGNLIQRNRWSGGFSLRQLQYPSSSNRLTTQRDSTSGSILTQNFDYDAAGGRMHGMRQYGDTTYWQYDALSRLVGTARRHPDPEHVAQHLDECRWDPSWRLAQPCGNSGQLALMGENVTRSSLGWFFVHAPGIDEVLLLIHRSDQGVIHQRLQAVTDGRGQLLSIADSSGFITATYAGSGYDQAAWMGAGLTSRADRKSVV